MIRLAKDEIFPGQDLPDIMAGPDAAVLPGRPVAEAGDWRRT